MTLNEAFGLLIQEQNWYQNSGMIRQAAARDKRYFLAGKKIPEERMRTYLKAAGWVQTQQEEWDANKPSDSSFLHSSTQ